jgi:3-hydroxyisobutyrate dehydrogenase
MTTTESVAVLGAGGIMGRPMASNLARAGYAVRAWNRSPDKAEPLREDGVELFATPREAARGATVILTMLSDADAVLAAMDGEDGALAAGLDSPLWLQMSTIGIDGIERAVALAAERGAILVDAPVLGTKQPAEQAQLVILASGPDDVRDRVAPIFDTLGRKTMWLGPAGAGSRMKVATNSWLVAVVEGAAETIALARALEADPHELLDAFAGGPLDMPYLQLKGRAMIEGDFAPSFPLRHAAKDAAFAAEAALRHDLDLPALQVIRRRMAEAAALDGDLDVSGVYRLSTLRRP